MEERTVLALTLAVALGLSGAAAYALRTGSSAPRASWRLVAVEKGDLEVRASSKSADVAVSRARQNLGYATIRAPVSGTVVERDVDVGQTVAASLTAPKLFLIANDLSEMQILASVDESDIGRLRPGQPVRFTVKAFPNRTFRGSVRQVRLQSVTEQNVVSYTVVVAVKNPGGMLLPGMTATVEFVTATAADVLKVPNAALRFRPPADVLAGVAQARPPSHRPPGGPARAAFTPRASESGFGMLWIPDGKGSLKPLPVKTGISDGQSTEVSGPSLIAGTKVVFSTQKGTKTAEAEATTNPFQSQRPQDAGGPPPPPGGF